MKKLILFISLLYFNLMSINAQNVGIGTTSPVEKLDVNGPVKIGYGANSNPGTIRWNAVKNDFEGFNGAAWVSLTGGKSRWGNQQSFVTENDASQNSLLAGSNGNRGDYLGESLAIDNGIIVAGARGDFYSPGQHSYAGSVYLYTKNEGGISVKAVVRNPTPEYGENFGASVSFNSNRLMVGANTVKFNNIPKGEAYIYGLVASVKIITSSIKTNFYSFDLTT